MEKLGNTIISPLINSKLPTFLPFRFLDKSTSPVSPPHYKTRHAIEESIEGLKRGQPRFQPAFSWTSRDDVTHGPREKERNRFSPAAVSHPSLLQIVYPSRGGPSTRRILYYRLEYLTRRETPRHRGIEKEVSSPRPALPSRVVEEVYNPNSFRLDFPR